ncbi:MAG: lipocalin-like domain-containing protein [Burkholderiales bacterium]
MKRRHFLITALATLASGARAEPAFPDVVPGTPLVFPRDHGSHPAFRTEWWYVTGWVRDDAGHDYGVQVTFFRSRTGLAEDSRSRFAPTQILFAHAAIADPRNGSLLHDQRALREGFGIAEASQATTDVRIGDWSLVLAGDTYTTRIAAREFTLDLAFTATQPVLLQGDGGVSRKGPLPAHASYYYSRPHLATQGTIARGGRTLAVRGTAWLDHEWSSSYLAPDAKGWDWTGINFTDGGALMAFRIRGRDGRAVWAGATLRDAAGRVTTFAPDEVAFTPLREWRSPRTDARYPVAMKVRVGDREYELAPLMDDAELDSRASVGTVYWEGAVRAQGRDREEVGRGYLELTGYAGRLRI